MSAVAVLALASHTRRGDEDDVDVEYVYAHHFCRRGRRSKTEIGSAARAHDSFKRMLYVMAALAVVVIFAGALMNWVPLIGLGSLALIWLAVVYFDS